MPVLKPACMQIRPGSLFQIGAEIDRLVEENIVFQVDMPVQVLFKLF
jgi:hypothetical protein